MADIPSNAVIASIVVLLAGNLLFQVRLWIDIRVLRNDVRWLKAKHPDTSISEVAASDDD